VDAEVIAEVVSKMTGVPLTEAALKTRRPDYADYIRKTSPFFPRPPRKEAA
jgi:steroid 5-alpha reductase family enzyme